MKNIFGFLVRRTRQPRPDPIMSVPAAFMKHYRSRGRFWAVAGVIGISYGVLEHRNNLACMARPPVTLSSILSPQGAIIKTFASDSLTDDDFEMVAEAAAAQFVKRMRHVTNPIDFTMAELEEGNYFVKDAAAGKVQQWINSQPFEGLTKRRQSRVVHLEQIIATIQPGRGKGGDQVRVTVQWPETVESAGSTPVTVSHGGEVLVERVRNVSPKIVRHNPIGLFITDFSFSTTD